MVAAAGTTEAVEVTEEEAVGVTEAAVAAQSMEVAAAAAVTEVVVAEEEDMEPPPPAVEVMVEAPAGVEAPAVDMAVIHRIEVLFFFPLYLLFTGFK